ncbi:MAG: hypothetical protein WCK28_10825 [Burkholderiales bacterium]|jgi:hypothetical protein
MTRLAPAALLITLFAAGCATQRAPYYPDVRPAADGNHRTVFAAERKDGHFQPAFAQARDFCWDVHQKRPVVSNEETRYVGSMPESTYIAMQTASGIAMGAGSAVGVFGNNSGTRSAGFGTAVAGGVVKGVMAPGYEYTLGFRCE